MDDTSINICSLLVKTKILCQDRQSLSMPLNQEHNSAHFFSIMLACLHLSPSPTVLGRSLELHSIKSHLWVLHKVEDNRECFWTGFPSEPIVTIGCAELLHTITTKSEVCYLDFWNHLIEYIQWHKCNLRCIGKLLGCALSIMAMDHVSGTSELNNPLHFGHR